MTRKRIYRFRSGHAEGRAEWRGVLGGKGANLAEMANMGIPVPPGFTLTTDMCVEFLRIGRMPGGLMTEVRAAIVELQEVTGRCFGRGEAPLLLSVRSGARTSMPGMMDTILDLGLHRDLVPTLAERTGSERFAYDAYRRLLTMYGGVVLAIESRHFEAPLLAAREEVARARGISGAGGARALARVVPDSLLPVVHLRQICAAYEELIRELTGEPFPADPYVQLESAIMAVFRSWNTPRACLYRNMNGIPDDWGTAVNVQTMVFGNLGDTSATGVAFTRDPSTGERRFFGEWLPNAQGEDVVAGVRTPRPLAKRRDSPGGSLEEQHPDAYVQLTDIQRQLEAHFRDMQDIEFTIEEGKLFVLQTRRGKRTAHAAVRIAVEMVDEGMLHPDEAILRVDASRLQELLFTSVDPQAAATPIAQGLAASPGAVTGHAAFSSVEAQARARDGDSVILIRSETSPEDLHGMKVAKGIVTAHGGATSHAAVVARGMGRACVAGCAAIGVDETRGLMEVHGPDGHVTHRIARGDLITIDGSTGLIYRGSVPTLNAALGEHMLRLLRWSDEVARMQVRANADTPAQAEKALALGARGIGLCRTEHMFFDPVRIETMREMILAPDAEARTKALGKLLPYQIQDFIGLFRIMQGFPVTVRLLDPPLHEFLPRTPEQVAELAAGMGISSDEVARRIDELSESNPMLGHRGVRLAISFPDIARMQVRAILTAACRVASEGAAVDPEIMVPLAFSRGELIEMRAIVDEVSREVFEAERAEVAFRFGTMIELPRAALLADQLAEVAEFFSFGTNDLTQTTLGLSRDDSASFLARYVRHGLLAASPFATLDREGVGRLIRMALEAGRSRRPDITTGICGEHGGDPDSIAFCEQAGLDYVSCSPFRVPIARVAVAQAALRQRP